MILQSGDNTEINYSIAHFTVIPETLFCKIELNNYLNGIMNYSIDKFNSTKTIIKRTIH